MIKSNMNRKKGKQKNNCNSSNKIDSGQEVLVLPPNLLQKLGINLGKMCGNQDSSAVFNKDISCTKAPALINEDAFQQGMISTEKNKESSIIETANLMKKSVFLSPTFNTSQSVTLSNSLELGSTTSLEKLYIENVDLDKNENSTTRNKKHCDNCEDDFIDNQDLTTHNKHDSLNSTITLKPSTKSLNEECATQTKTVDKYKINILSEEIVNPFKLSTLRPLIDVHDRNALVPIPIDTFISISKHHNDDIKTLNNNTSMSNNESKAINSNNLTTKHNKGVKIQATEEKNGEISRNDKTEIAKDSKTLAYCNKSCENIHEKTIPSKSDATDKFKNFKHEQYIKNVSGMEKNDTLKLASNKACDDANISNTIGSQTNQEYLNDKSGASVNKNQLDSVETIANILFQHLKKEKESNIEKMSAEEIFFTSKQSKAKSKLSVQGVEKPGGDIILNRCRELYTRTYARNRKNNIAKKSLIAKDHEVDLDTSNLQVDCAKDVCYTHVQIPKQFCICFDFGYLKHNINLESYIHPHFFNPKNCSTLDEMISIYFEDDLHTINRVDCDNIHLEETSDCDSLICCNAINLDSDIEEEYTDLSSIVDKENNITISTPKTKTSFIMCEKANVCDNFPDSLLNVNQGKPAQESPEALTVQNMQLHGFETSDINIDTKKGHGSAVKLIRKKRKLSVPENEESKTDCHKPKRGRKPSSVSNKKLGLISRDSKPKDSDNPNDSESIIADAESSVMVEIELERDVRCAVCSASVPADRWLSHAKGHAYLAWVDGHTPLDVTDKNAVRNHLVNICNEVGALTCTKCMTEERNVDSYLAHTKRCGNVEASSKSVDSSTHRDAVGAACAEGTAGTAGAANQGAVQCGVCDAWLRRDEWTAHAAIEHNYLAWIHGQPKLDLKDKDAVYNHLYRTSKEIGGLMCAKCGRRRKYVKAYLNHVKSCNGEDAVNTSVNESLNQSTTSINTTVNKPNTTIDGGSTTVEDHNIVDSEAVVCGVCGARVVAAAWIEHARTYHDYLAWTQGQTPLDTSDKKAVDSHLKQILKETGDLICGKCNEKRRYIKSYLRHVRNCGISDVTVDSSVNNTLDISETSVCETRDTQQSVAGEISGDDDSDVTCGVCGACVRRADWIEHTSTQHNYFAWMDGQPPLDLDDEEEVYNHLSRIKKKYRGLKCNKCGKTKKYVKSYLVHVKTCETVSPHDLTEKHNLDIFECAVCAEKVEPISWKDHAMSKHYNIAWIVGETPIDLKNSFATEKYLKEYKQQYNKLECKVCGLVRVSCAGFYAHIIQCGKSDEETEIYKSVCEICNNKYLCVYRSQHMAMHREQENAKQRKLQQAEKKAQAEKEQDEEPVEVSGRRRAAEKAKNVIAKYNKSMGGEDEDGASKNADGEAVEQAEMDSDASAEIDSASSSSDSDSSVETDHSVAELVALNKQKKRKKKKYPETHTSNIKRIPFMVKNVKAFLAESVDDFSKKYLCADVLYAQWRRSELTPVPAARAHLYMPIQKNSCQVMIGTKQWTTYELFEARVGKEMSFFVGGCIQWISWAPPRAGDNDNQSGNFLAVGSHREPDAPRLDVASVYEHPSMLQIWDFGDMTAAPKLSLCIALECGTVWAGAWCPSGVRDAAAPRARLGLLAVASSSGAAYILPVPYPDTVIECDKSLYKIKPVAELRFSRGEREKYQATSITWSTEKGHSVVVVGYADGSLGYYNIEHQFPLLTDEEDGVKIFYPYDEEQRHYSCITDVATVVGGAVCSTSQTGAALRARGAAMRSLLPATRAAPLQHWPAVIVAGNDLIVTHTVNELEYWGAGRRLGSLQCCGGCACCGAVAAVSPPALRLMRLHPAYKDSLKMDIATIQMTRLDNKKSKIKNDDLSVVIEPRRYEDAIKTYGVEFKYLTGKDTLSAAPSKDQCCERFPLAECVGVAFCPAPAHHKSLALALNCGLVVLLST